MKPSLSIIIPTLNEEHYIGRLLDSILKQRTQYAFEIIVVDGMSEDATVKTAKIHSENLQNARIIRSTKRGISYQRNLGAKYSKGQFIVFLDADIVLPQNFISTLMKQLPKERLFIGTCFPLLNDLNFGTLLLSVISYPIGIYLSWLHKMTLGYCTVVNRDIHMQIGGYNEKIIYAEDTEYGRRALAQGANFKYFWNPPVYFSVRRLVKTRAIPWLITKFKESYIQKGAADNQNITYQFGIFRDKK